MNDKIDRILEIGCIVCKNEGVSTPAEFHHIHGPDHRRVGNKVGIGLCYYHHRSGTRSDRYVSRHPFKKEWEKRSGTELELYQQVLKLLEAK